MELRALYVEKLLHIVSEHALCPNSSSIRALIEEAQSRESSLETFHDALNLELNKPEPRMSRWAQWRHRAEIQQNQQLLAQLKQAMLVEIDYFDLLKTSIIPAPANQSLGQIQKLEQAPYSSNRFIRELFLAYMTYTQYEFFDADTASGVLIRNAILALSNLYKAHSKLFLDTSDSNVKAYHGMRLLILQEWLTPEGYLAFINAILASQTGLGKEGFKLGFDPSAMNVPSHPEQHLLNWLAIVFSSFRASETPFAMSHARKIFAQPTTDLDQNTRNNLLLLVNQFNNFYVGEKSVAPINIDGSYTKLLTDSINALNQATGDSKQFQKAIEKVKVAVFNAYLELSPFLIKHNQLLEQFDALLSKDNKNSTQQFLNLAKEALDFINLAKKSQGTIEITNGLFCTPYVWSDLQGSDESISRRLSNRSSERSSFGSSSKKEKSSRKQSIEHSSSRVNELSSSNSLHSFFKDDSQDSSINLSGLIRSSSSQDTTSGDVNINNLI